MASQNVLLIGATGNLGLQIIRAASLPSAGIALHAFCRTPSKLSAADASSCASVVRGDARSSADVRRALLSTRASVIIMATGGGSSVAPTDVRFATAKALMDVIEHGQDFDHVKVVVVSSTGAGGTKMNIGFGIGTVLGHYLRYPMRDHTEQEQEFKRRVGDKNRLLIVRPTALTDGKAKGSTRVFPKNGRVPTMYVDRADVANWIVTEISKGEKAYGREVNLTGGKH